MIMRGLSYALACSSFRASADLFVRLASKFDIIRNSGVHRPEGFFSAVMGVERQPHLHWHAGASVGTFFLITDKVY
jgi:hypothetical protein